MREATQQTCMWQGHRSGTTLAGRVVPGAEHMGTITSAIGRHRARAAGYTGGISARCPCPPRQGPEPAPSSQACSGQETAAAAAKSRWETQKPPPISGQGATAAQGWEAPGHTQALGPSAALCLNNPVAWRLGQPRTSAHTPPLGAWDSLCPETGSLGPGSPLLSLRTPVPRTLEERSQAGFRRQTHHLQEQHPEQPAPRAGLCHPGTRKG